MLERDTLKSARTQRRPAGYEICLARAQEEQMASAFHIYLGFGAATRPVKVRKVEARDCIAALAEGFEDVVEMPTYPAFVGLFYGLAESR